ncbi:hypothetical protein [Okeania sp. KiyG1]|uniref:hypothetical protein n=1 Tax=Okeania sp. KiyG1 TaxID=2720165 RepID=UPI0019A5804C|nr:hypothetical protein [Okeania sp. KiyG1]GGA16767.1 hypothetical protein CYANOKiyG1_30890 [Okeania sp. KiyG1]
MTANTPVVKPISQIQLAAGSVMTIPNINWQEFELILQELGEKRAAKIAYSNNTLKIMVPLPEHEISKDLISDVIKILLKKQVKSINLSHQLLLKRKVQQELNLMLAFIFKIIKK